MCYKCCQNFCFIVPAGASMLLEDQQELTTGQLDDCVRNGIDHRLLQSILVMVDVLLVGFRKEQYYNKELSTLLEMKMTNLWVFLKYITVKSFITSL